MKVASTITGAACRRRRPTTRMGTSCANVQLFSQTPSCLGLPSRLGLKPFHLRRQASSSNWKASGQTSAFSIAALSRKPSLRSSVFSVGRVAFNASGNSAGHVRACVR